MIVVVGEDPGKLLILFEEIDHFTMYRQAKSGDQSADIRIARVDIRSFRSIHRVLAPSVRRQAGSVSLVSYLGIGQPGLADILHMSEDLLVIAVRDRLSGIYGGEVQCADDQIASVEAPYLSDAELNPHWTVLVIAGKLERRVDLKDLLARGRTHPHLLPPGVYNHGDCSQRVIGPSLDVSDSAGTIMGGTKRIRRTPCVGNRKRGDCVAQGYQHGG